MSGTILKLPEIVLHGAEVALRPLQADDASALAEASAESRENYKFNPVPNGIAEASEYIRLALEQRESGVRYPFAILRQGHIVGSTSYSDFQPWSWPKGSVLQRTDRPDVCEIGFTWLAASAQRTRCNTEAKYLLLSHAFQTWKVHRVCLRTDERNQRSRNAIERLGAKFEGIRRADKPATDDTVRDSAFYSITLSEWPAVRERLQNFLSRPH
jgi:RimJ/RimL family protein N-acetyltransferase